MEMLNENDIKLINFCKGKPKSITEISKYLDIAPKNVSVRLKKLVEKKLISIDQGGRGKKTFVKAREDKKVQKYIFYLLQELEKAGGRMNLEKFHGLLPFDISNDEDYDKSIAPLMVQFSKLVNHEIVLSKEGKEYLEEKK